MVKNLPAVWKTRLQSLDREDPPERGMATHSNILAWRSPWMDRAAWLATVHGSQRVKHDWATNTFIALFL